MACGGRPLIFLDTHAVLWLYQKNLEKFTQRGLNLVEKEELLISPMVELEMEYLFEIGKIRERSSAIMDYLRARIGLKVSDAVFSEVIQAASTMKWTRDPFDRVITAAAALLELPLLTKNRTILTHYPKAVW